METDLETYLMKWFLRLFFYSYGRFRSSLTFENMFSVRLAVRLFGVIIVQLLDGYTGHRKRLPASALSTAMLGAIKKAVQR